MSYSPIDWPSDKAELYHLLTEQAAALAEATPLPTLCNTAALLWDALRDINWCGFYLLRGDALILGPFQGKVACTAIPMGRGVCGTAAATRKLQLVPDVHLFPGHIACDSASASEIVVPMIKDDRLIGVLDIDSPLKARFDEQDAEGLTSIVHAMLGQTDWSDGLL